MSTVLLFLAAMAEGHPSHPADGLSSEGHPKAAGAGDSTSGRKGNIFCVSVYAAVSGTYQ